MEYCRFAFIFLIFPFIFFSANSQNIERISEEKIISASGSIGINLSAYGMSGIESRYRPFDYSLIGSLTVNLFGIAFPFTATFSEQQRSFIQPFNQYGVSPKYKWITVHAGWRSLNFSPYTLSGHTFLGGGIELNPSIFRFAAMYGRFFKASTGDSNSISRVYPTYERNGYAIKLGVGSMNNYVDLIFLKAADVTGSISDSLQNIVKPAENVVLGLTSRFSPFSFLGFEVDASASLYTLDTRSMSITDSFNVDILKKFKSIFTIHTSTQLTTAFQSAVVYRGSGYNLKLAYKRIEPDYKSMGTYYSESDVENITFAPSVTLLGNSLRLGGSIGVQNDNLLNNKANTSQRIIGSIDISYNKQVYGIDLRYSSYGITQTRGLNPVIDSIKISRVNHNFNIVGRYSLAGEKSFSNFILTGGYQTLLDLNARTANNTETQNYTSTLTYQCTLADWGLNYGININAVVAIQGVTKNSFIGPIVQANYNLKSINFGGSFGYQFQNINGLSSGATITATIQASYQLTNNHSVRFDANMIKSEASTTGNPKFTEYRSNFGYMYTF